jgi:C-terminal processing protease CtpA/Prc
MTMRAIEERQRRPRGHGPAGHLPALLALILLAACATPYDRTPTAPMTRELVVADMNSALAAIADIHPNPHWRASPAAIERTKQELIAALPAQPTAAEVIMTLRRLTAALNDAHVNVTDVPLGLRGGDGSSLISDYRQGGGALTARFDPNAETLRVIEAGAADAPLRPGDVIESINGVPAAEVLARMEAMMPGGPQTKRRSARLELGSALWFLGLKAPYRMALAPADGGAARTVTVRGSLGTAQPDEEARAERALEYRLLPDRIGLIGFHEMLEEPGAFARRFDAVALQVQKDRPRGLIVDIRNNPGGNSLLGDILLTLVTVKPYRPFAERRWKVSQSCKDYFATLDREVREEYFKEYRTKPVGTTVVDAIEVKSYDLPKLAFKGPVATLIGPETFSSATILADAMKTYGLATLFGQPTGEPANQYGEVCQKVLPHSNITVAAPSAFIVRADGDAETLDPVFPDFPVEDDRSRPGFDPVLDAARRWIAAQSAGTS